MNDELKPKPTGIFLKLWPGDPEDDKIIALVETYRHRRPEYKPLTRSRAVKMMLMERAIENSKKKDLTGDDSVV